MSDPSPDPAAAAPLLERLLADPGFREEFRRDPEEACRRLGLPELGEQVASRGKALYTLDARESRSSLAGALAAVAAEAIGVVDLVAHARTEPESEMGRAMSVVFTRMDLSAVRPDPGEVPGLGGGDLAALHDATPVAPGAGGGDLAALHDATPVAPGADGGDLAQLHGGDPVDPGPAVEHHPHPEH